MKALWKGQVIAESDDIVVVEGNRYFPRESVNPAFVTDSSKTTVCPWKGRASYLTIEVDGSANKDAAWYYADPLPTATHIRDRVAFWRGVEVTA